MKFHQSVPTLEKIKSIIQAKKKGVYFRFGDGDVVLANNENEMLQPANTSLANEFRQCFAIKGDSIIKTLPLNCAKYGGFEKGMTPGNHECPDDWCDNIVKKCKPYWPNVENDDVYSTVALAYTATYNLTYCISFLKFLKNSNCSLCIGNENISPDIITKLFGDKCLFIKTPSKQSYSHIDEIEKECIEKDKLSEYRVFITCMGCPGRPLQMRLWKRLDNVFLFDFGSLIDALNGYDNRAWMSISGFNKESFWTEWKSKGN